MSINKTKKIISYIKLVIPSGRANPSPPIGPALGQKKLNIMEFCKSFNTLTQSFESCIPVPVMITVYNDNTFTFIIKTSHTSYYLRKFAQIDKGSSIPKKGAFVGKIQYSDCLKIAKIKLPDLNTTDLTSAVKVIIGTAESMGIEIIKE